MSTIQRGVLFAAAVAIAIFTWFSFEDGDIRGVNWLWPSLAIAALLYFATRDLDLRKAVEAAAPDKRKKSETSPKMQKALDDFAKVTVTLASTIQMKNDILRVIAPQPVDGDADVQDLQAQLMSAAEIEAFILAYTLHWCEPKRRPRTLPTEPEFLFYRSEIKRRLIACVAGGPQIPDTLSTMLRREVVPHNAHHETFASNKLGEADRCRMEFEQNAEIGPLLEPAIDAALFADPGDAKVALARVLAKHLGIH